MTRRSFPSVIRNTMCHSVIRTAGGARHSITGSGPDAGVRLAASHHGGHQRTETAIGRRPLALSNRSFTMHLLIEEMSRDRMRSAHRELEAIRLARRLRAARKQRRSIHAT